MKASAAILVVVLLGGCASRPAPDAGPTPIDVRSSGIASGQVHWGGQVVAIENLRDRTLVEVLALPLASDGEPLTDRRPQGRFIVNKSGFLEPHEYPPGSLVEVRGLLNGFVDGTVGDSPYRYPLVVSERVKRWASPRTGGVFGPGSRHSIGIGAGSNGGSWGGVGIGIGF